MKVVDNSLRGQPRRLSEVINDIELIEVDVRDQQLMTETLSGPPWVFHLAAINGTENFYSHPDLVLDVGIRGMLSVVHACIASSVPDLVVASSAEVYQTPAVIPTGEDAALCLPDSNPRYSYGGSKIISELIAFNYGKNHFRKVQVFRPHNVYGPDMGWKHAVPQLITQAIDLNVSSENANEIFKIRGSGTETRAFAFIDDVINGILLMYEKGKTREVYHIGVDVETSILDLANHIIDWSGKKYSIAPGEPLAIGAERRCPDISKMKSLGYRPKNWYTRWRSKTADWYFNNSHLQHKNPLL